MDRLGPVKWRTRSSLVHFESDWKRSVKGHSYIMDDSATFYVNSQPNQDETETNSFDEHSTLDGELVTSSCERVLLYTSFSDNRQGLLGTLFCTNYRLCFIASDTNEPCCSRSVFARNKHDIPLMCIEQIYYAMVTNDGSRKFRAMSSPLSGCDALSSMKIYTKDYRTFEFGLAASQFSVQLLNLAFHFAFPAKPGTVFRTQFPLRKGHKSNMNVLNGSFNERVDWDRELHRTGAAMKRWRLAQFNVFADRNVHKTHVPTYPDSVVVPSAVTDDELQSLCACYELCRIPVWVWSSHDGCALLRAAATNQSLDSSTLLQRTNHYMSAVSQTHPKKRGPFEINLSDSIPSLSKLTICYEAFRKLCTINSPQHFEEIDGQWLTSVEAAGWMYYVAQCMKTCRRAVRRFVEHSDTVMLIEQEGARDYVCLVSSIVQLCMDPYYRTINGFAVLIQKHAAITYRNSSQEWLALGHPFGQRLFGFNKNCTTTTKTADSNIGLNDTNTSAQDTQREMTPVFLLFVDCVYQLLRLYPAEFEFTPIYLISLWDVILSGLATACLYNGLQDTQHVHDLCAIWPLDRFYSERHGRLFTSAHYACRKLTALVDNHTQTNVVRKYLYPPEHVTELTFWNELYLRWAAPAHMRDGGDIQSSLLLNGIAVQIMDLLQEKAEHEPNESGDVVRALSPHLRLYSTDTHNMANLHTDSLSTPVTVTSSFPYNNEVLSLHDQVQQRLPQGVRLSGSGPATVSDSRLSQHHNRLSTCSTDIDVERLCAYYTQNNTLAASALTNQQSMITVPAANQQRAMQRMQSVPEHSMGLRAHGHGDGASGSAQAQNNVQVIQKDDQYIVTLNTVLQ